MKAMNPNKKERYKNANALISDLEEFRSVQLNIESGVSMADGRAMNVHPGEDKYQVIKNVKPLSRSGELSKEAARRNYGRSRKVSMLSGIGIVLVCLIGLAVFLYNFWVKELFAEPVRKNIPDFIGSYFTDIENNPNFDGIFRFTATYENSEEDKGVIIGQYPAYGKSIMFTEGKLIDITLMVSAGIDYIKVPNVINLDYREAETKLRDAGFAVATETVFSDSITKEFVVETDPVAGTELAAGKTVTLLISDGPAAKYVTMPNLVGLDRADAVKSLERYNLAFAVATEVLSYDYEAGVVIWQSVPAGEQVQEHSKIYLQVSTGPGPEESPPLSDG